eukprot:2025847-Rhodomonas_salina.8
MVRGRGGSVTQSVTRCQHGVARTQPRPHPYQVRTHSTWHGHARTRSASSGTGMLSPRQHLCSLRESESVDRAESHADSNFLRDAVHSCCAPA